MVYLTIIHVWYWINLSPKDRYFHIKSLFEPYINFENFKDLRFVLTKRTHCFTKITEVFKISYGKASFLIPYLSYLLSLYIQLWPSVACPPYYEVSSIPSQIRNVIDFSNCLYFHGPLSPFSIIVWFSQTIMFFVSKRDLVVCCFMQEKTWLEGGLGWIRGCM